MFLMRRDPAEKEQIERLAGWLDALVTGQAFELRVADRPWADIAQALRAQLHFVEPDPEFVGRLRLRLIAAADQRAPVEEQLIWRQPRFIIGAAGLMSAAAVIALFARSRMQARAA